MSVHIVIPARLASTRLPNKLLLDIAGKPMLQHVVERASRAKAKSVTVATDNEAIFSLMESLGVDVCMTSSHHQSGTERVAEAVEKLGFASDDIVVSVQGDEPLLPPRVIEQVADDLMQHPDAAVATLYEEMQDVADIHNPNIVKLVLDQQSYALYFSRAAIPWHRDGFALDKKSLPSDFVYKRHVGLYAYRVAFLNRYVQLDASPIESIEMLEQLRVLYYGEKIHASLAVEMPGHGVDTAEDLERVRSAFSPSS